MRTEAASKPSLGLPGSVMDSYTGPVDRTPVPSIDDRMRKDMGIKVVPTPELSPDKGFKEASQEKRAAQDIQDAVGRDKINKKTAGSVSKSTFDFASASEYKPPDDDAPGWEEIASPLKRGMGKAASELRKTYAGTWQAIGDAVGSDRLSQGATKAYNEADRKQDAIGSAKGNGPQQLLETGVFQALSNVPSLAIGAMTGGLGTTTQMAASLSSMFVHQFGNSYGEGIQQGLDGSSAGQRAFLMSVFEVAGESIGMPKLFQAWRAFATDVPTSKLLDSFKHYAYKELGGEMLTTTGQDATDMLPGIGTHPGLNFGEYVDHLKDTIYQTVAQTAVMGGGTMGMHHAIRTLRGGQADGAPSEVAAMSTMRDAFDRAAAAKDDHEARDIISKGVIDAHHLNPDHELSLNDLQDSMQQLVQKEREHRGTQEQAQQEIEQRAEAQAEVPQAQDGKLAPAEPTDAELIGKADEQASKEAPAAPVKEAPEAAQDAGTTQTAPEGRSSPTEAVIKPETASQPAADNAPEEREITSAINGDSRLAGKQLKEGDVRIVETPEAYAGFVDGISKALGRKVKFVEAPEHLKDYANGMQLDGRPDTVYVFQHSTDPLPWVVGHEVFHSLPDDIKAQVIDALRDSFKDEGAGTAFHARQNEASLSPKAKAQLLKEFTKTRDNGTSRSEEEMIADYVGRRFMDPKFWDNLSKKNPTAFESLAKHGRELLQKLAEFFKGSPSNTDWVKHTQKASKVIEDALAEHAKRIEDERAKTPPGKQKVLDTIAKTKVKAKSEKKPKVKKAAPVKAGKSEGPNLAPPHFNLPYSADKWTKVGDKLGTNEGGTFLDEHGDKWYVKFPKNTEQARTEVAASALYMRAGVIMPGANLVHRDGKLGVGSLWDGDLRKATPDELRNPKYPDQLARAFAMSVILKNWDVVGLGSDNLMIDKKGNLVHVDAGASMEYRAQGEKKPFGVDAQEADTLRDPAKNSDAAYAFGKLTDDQIRTAIKEIKQRLSLDKITEAVRQGGFATDAKVDELTHIITGRMAQLEKRFAPVSGTTHVTYEPKSAAKKKYNPITFVNDKKTKEWSVVENATKKVLKSGFKKLDQAKAWNDANNGVDPHSLVSYNFIPKQGFEVVNKKDGVVEGNGFKKYKEAKEWWEKHYAAQQHAEELPAVDPDMLTQHAWEGDPAFADDVFAQPQDVVTDDEIGLPEKIVPAYHPKPSEWYGFDQWTKEHHPLVNSPEFKEWFGKSTQVDADGNPLIWIHSGRFGGITEFRQGHQGRAIFMSREIGFASSFGSNRDIYRLYVRAENPFDFRNLDHQDKLRAYLQSLADKHSLGHVTLSEEQFAGQALGTHTVDQWMNMVRKGDWSVIESTEIRNWIEAQGHDSYYTHEITLNLAVLDGHQLKSVDGNNGNWSREEKSINLSPPRDPGAARAVGLFRVTDPTKLDKATEKFIDRFNRVLYVQDRVHLNGGSVNDANNVYLALERYPGRTEARVRDFTDGVLKPIIDDAGKRNVQLKDAMELAYVMHAKERNEYIASINKEMPDGGSGITTAEAERIMQAFQQSPDYADVLHVANAFKGVTQMTRDLLNREGLLSDAEKQAWERYKDYVPLRGGQELGSDLDASGHEGTGRMFDQRGNLTKPAMGRYTIADPTRVMADIVADHFSAIVRAEKNRIGKHLMKLVLDNPDSALWAVDEQKIVRSIVTHPDGTKEVVESLKLQKGPNTIVTKVGGREYYINIHDEAMARQLTGANEEHSKLLMNTLGNFNRMVVKFWTQLNPTFTVRNFLRDAQSGMIHTVAEKGWGRAAAIAQYTPSAIRAMWQYQRGKRTGSNMLSYVHQYIEGGGKIGYVDMKSVAQQAQDIQQLYEQGTQSALRKVPRAVGKALIAAVSDANTAIENGIRISAYRAAVEAGETPTQALSIAKNLTVNFNKRGTIAPTMNAIALFYNPSIQGAVRIAQAAKRAPKALGAIAAMHVGLGYALAMLGSQEEDEDGVSYWDKPQVENMKQRNFVFVVPGSGGNAVTIPMPWGYNTFVQLGYSLADAQRGVKKPSSIAADVASALIQGWAPVGGNMMQGGMASLLPNTFQPIVQLTANKDDFGSQILPGDEKKPDSERYRTQTRGSVLQQFTQWMNEATGGDANVPGAVSISPETFNYLGNYVFGGVGKFFLNSMDTATNILTGGDLDYSKVPYLNDYFIEHKPERDSRLFYDRLTDLQSVVASYKQAEAAGEAAKTQEMRDRYGEKMIVSLGSSIHEYQSAIKALKDEEIVVRDGGDPAGLKQLKLSEIDARRGKVMLEFNKLFSEASDGKLSLPVPPRVL